MNHTQKVRLAKKMMTPEELKNKVSIWDSAEWLRRSKAIRIRILKKRNE